MNKYENVMVNVMIKMHFSLPINSRRKANHSYSYSTKMQGSKPTSQHHCNAQDAEPEGRTSASLQYQDVRVETTSLLYCDGQDVELETCILVIYAILRHRAQSPRLT